MELSNEAMSAAGFSKPYTQEAFDKYDSGLYPNEYSNTDWIDKIYKSRAFQTGHNVSARGGSEKTGFFMSYGFLDQDGSYSNPNSDKHLQSQLSYAFSQSP